MLGSQRLHRDIDFEGCPPLRVGGMSITSKIILTCMVLLFTISKSESRSWPFCNWRNLILDTWTLSITVPVWYLPFLLPLSSPKQIIFSLILNGLTNQMFYAAATWACPLPPITPCQTQMFIDLRSEIDKKEIQISNRCVVLLAVMCIKRKMPGIKRELSAPAGHVFQRAHSEASHVKGCLSKEVIPFSLDIWEFYSGKAFLWFVCK